jgi:DNA repair protein RecO (recombination protein O)
MPLVKTEGIILQGRKYSETSKILSLFTLDSGLISVLAKGGRKGTKKFPGGLETLNRVELQYYHKPNRDLQNFKSSDLMESYQGLRSGLPRTYTALSLSETILRTVASEDPNASLYSVLLKALETLNKMETNPWTIRWKYLIEICPHLGFGLSLDGCAFCGNRETIKAFDFKAGGFVCRDHVGGETAKIPSSAELWGILRFLWSCKYSVVTRITVSAKIGRIIEGFFLQYFKYHIPALKTLESWKKLPAIYWGEGDQ